MNDIYFYESFSFESLVIKEKKKGKVVTNKQMTLLPTSVKQLSDQMYINSLKSWKIILERPFWNNLGKKEHIHSKTSPKAGL